MPPLLHPSGRGPAGAARVFAVPCVFLVMCLAVAAFGHASDRVAVDEGLFQLPVVRQFARQWPRPDLRDYPAATAPGYHLLLAAVSHYASDRLAVLRCVGGVFGVALVALLAWATRRRSAALAMPLAASSYVIASTAFVLPENAAWLGVLVALLLCLHAGGGRLLVGLAVTLALLVFVRQSQAWLMAVAVVAAFAGPAVSARRAALTALALLPALIVLGVLVTLWHGLTPPSFRPGATTLPLATASGGFAPGAPMTVLAVLGLLGTPLVAWLWPARGGGRAALVGAAAGFVVGVATRSDSAAPDRVSGIWNLARHVPTVADRSPLVVGLATLGGAVAALALARLHGRPRWVLATALAAFTISQMASALLWQRYYEPFVLIWLALAAAEGDATPTPTPTPTPTSRPTAGRVSRAVGLALLVAWQLAITAYTFAGATTATPG